MLLTCSTYGCEQSKISSLLSRTPKRRRSCIQQKHIIINCLSPAVYPHVEEAETYDRIVQILKALNFKRKNNVYARHLLVSRRQASAVSISEFLHILYTKECTFSDVTADMYCEELNRDAFVHGLDSSAIRLR